MTWCAWNSKVLFLLSLREFEYEAESRVFMCVKIKATFNDIENKKNSDVKGEILKWEREKHPILWEIFKWKFNVEKLKQ